MQNHDVKDGKPLHGHLLPNIFHFSIHQFTTSTRRAVVWSLLAW
jgi:hypothetical protein